MKKSRILGIAGLALAAGVGLAWAQGLAILTTLTGNEIIENQAGTVSSGFTTTTLAGYVGSSGLVGDTVIGTGVNKVSITGGATTVGPVITTGGTSSDTNIGILMAGKGTGAAHLGGTTLANGSLRVPTVALAVNQVQVSGAVTTGVAAITIGGTAADTNASINVAGIGTGHASLGGSTTCSGTTTATCSAQRFVVSITGLTTAAGGTTSAAMTVTNTLVRTSADQVICQVNGYGGTGIPIVSTVTPGTGSVSMTVTNVAGSGALNATVPIACVVL